MNLICVDPDEVHQVWPFVRDGVWTALNKGVGGAFNLVERDVLRGDALLWLAVEQQICGACITQLIETDQGRKCLILSLHGDGMDGWFGFLPKIEEFAKAEGCATVEVTGRVGWKRILKEYDQIGVVMSKRLN